MISSNKSPESENALLRRIQRYAQASTIFRTTDSSGNVAHGQSAANVPTKAILLSGPSSLPVGRTAVTQNFGRSSIMPDAFPTAFSTMPESTHDPVSAAIEQVTQMQRSPDPQVYASRPPVPAQIMPTPPPVTKTVPTAVNVAQVQAAPDSEKAAIDSDWSRLQRIIKGHEAKKEPVADSQSTQSAPPTVQRVETSAPPATPIDSIQRAVETAEASQSPIPPRKAPLESVWPVEHTEPEAALTTDEPIVMRQPDTPISTEPVQSAAEAEIIRRKLGDVSITQRSDSSIELHLPRRPRPAVIQTKPVKEDANKSFWDRMRKLEGKEPESIQRTVETEIGPLPADMWELLGETPPGTPTETTAASGESTPTIQTKREEDTARKEEVSSSPPSDIEETGIPSFLAEAATTAQPASDAVQRAIAAAESPEISPETVKVTEATDSPTPSVQRTETTTPDTPSAAAVPAPLKSESDVASSDVETTPAVEAASPTSAALPAESPIQRSALSPTESESVFEQRGATPSTSQSMPETTTPDSAPSKESGINQAAQIQRAIQAAEAPTSSTQETKPARSAASYPSVTPTASTAKPLQPMRQDSPEPASSTKVPTRVPESNAQEFSTVDSASVDESALGESLQRSAANPDSESSSFVPHTVDLNAETGPLPALANVWDGGETAVSPSSQTPDSSSDIQRAIAAAEAPASTDEPTSIKSERPLAAPPIIQMKKDATEASTPQAKRSTESITPVSPLENTSPIGTETAVPSATPAPETLQRAIAAAEAAPDPAKSTTEAQTAVSQTVTVAPAPVQRTVIDEAPASTPSALPETAVTTPAADTSTPDTIQRAIAAAETPASTPSALPETAVTTPTADTSTLDTIQRAIAAAETPASTPSVQSETAVTTPTADTSTPDTIQRAIAAAETPASTPSVQSETAVNTPAAETATPETLQRAIAAAELPTHASADSPFTSDYQLPAISQFTHPQSAVPQPSQETAVQRAIAAAEMAPSKKMTAPVIQRMPTTTQTAVATPTTFVQDKIWQGQTETAVATPPPPTATQSSTPLLMRAISTAESSPQPAKETYQWPDISPTVAKQNQHNIQRDEMDSTDLDFQEYGSASVSSMENAESTDENSNYVDVDKLANEVYSQLKKRLATEWERGRGKR